MIQIFVNLKRFEVPRARGGLCPSPDPIAWIEGVMSESAALGLGSRAGLHLTYLAPEGLLAAAARRLAGLPAAQTTGLAVGVQGVHWLDIAPGGNFGAFTTSLPAAAASHLGAAWAIIGHSEERRAKLQVINAYDPQPAAARAGRAVDALVQAELTCALHAGLHALVCVGETAEERGQGSLDEQHARVEQVLRAQVLSALSANPAALEQGRIVIGYEPVWAIGPGKTPPAADEIAFVAGLIQRLAQQELNQTVAVVYGGGLKEANAAEIAAIPAISGGLVGLTRFSGEIGFDVPGLAAIIEKYLQGGE